MFHSLKIKERTESDQDGFPDEKIVHAN